MENMDWKDKALNPNSCDKNPPSNNCNPTWDINLRYIDKNDLNAIYGYVPDADEVANGINLTDTTEVAISYASEKINIICGNKIEGIGFDNLNTTQQNLVKRATARMTIWYLKNGIAFLTSSVSTNAGGISTSITPPTEPDYVLNDVYGLLEQANLYQPVRSYTSNFCNEKYNNGSIKWGDGIYDQGDIQYVTWNQANKAFLRPSGIVSSDDSITHEDITDTQAKVNLNAKSGGDSNHIQIETTNSFTPNVNKPYVIVAGADMEINGTESQTQNRFSLDPKETDLSNYYTKTETNDLVNGKQDKTDNALQTTNKTIVGAINEINTKPFGEPKFDACFVIDPNNNEFVDVKKNLYLTSGHAVMNVPDDPATTKAAININTVQSIIKAGNGISIAPDPNFIRNIIISATGGDLPNHSIDTNTGLLQYTGGIPPEPFTIGTYVPSYWHEHNFKNYFNFSHIPDEGETLSLKKELIGGFEVYNNKITYLADGTNAKDAVNKSQLDTKQDKVVWTTVGTSANARIWNHILISGKRYRVIYHWDAPSGLAQKIYKEFISTGGDMDLETFVVGFSGVTVVGIAVLGTANVALLKAVSNGVQIVTKSGTTTNGRIVGLEELS